MRGIARARALVLVPLAGCFVQAGMSYSPSSTISVQRTSDPMPITVKDGTATINFRLGVNFDLAGVGVHHAWYAARVIRSAEGMPHQPNASGTHTRIDVDLPVPLGKALVLRGTYAWEHFDQLNNGGGTARGGGKHGGLTVATLNKDLSFSVLVGTYDFVSDASASDPAQPRLALETWDVDVGVTIRFVPSGTLVSRYMYEPGPIFTISDCGWRLSKHGGGFWCD